MAFDKVVDSSKLDAALLATANAIREQGGHNVKSASGAMISFDDGIIAPVVSAKINIESLQSGSGTPSFNNIRPFTGFTNTTILLCGENLVNNLTMESGYYNNSGAPIANNSLLRTVDYISCESNNSYCIAGSFNISNSRIRIQEYDTNKTWLRVIKESERLSIGKNFITWTPSSDAAYFRFSVPLYDNLLCSKLTQECSILFNGETIYSGVLDIINKKLVVNKAIVDLGTLNWTRSSSNNFMYSDGIASNIVKPSSNSEVTNAISSHMATVSANSVNTTSGDRIGVATNGNIRCRFDGFSTNPTTFKSSVSGVMLLYELVTPLIYDITNVLDIKTTLNQNTVWVDSGDIIEFKYCSSGLITFDMINNTGFADAIKSILLS